MPGEIFEIRNKTVYINGEALDEPYKVHETDLSLDSWEKIAKKGRVSESEKFVEQEGSPSRGGAPSFVDYGPFPVPADSVFLLGDNRDNSRDSRNYGPVLISSVRGRATNIHWSREPGKARIRWRRLGMSLVRRSGTERS
jgi:signal peptidase I